MSRLDDRDFWGRRREGGGREIRVFGASFPRGGERRDAYLCENLAKRFSTQRLFGRNELVRNGCLPSSGTLACLLACLQHPRLLARHLFASDTLCLLLRNACFACEELVVFPKSLLSYETLSSAKRLLAKCFFGETHVCETGVSRR